MPYWKDNVRTRIFEDVQAKFLTHGEALVLLRLADYADFNTGQNARPGIKLLADGCAMSDSTVSRGIDKGLELGFIALTKRGGGTGSSKRASNYRFLDELLPDNRPLSWRTTRGVKANSLQKPVQPPHVGSAARTAGLSRAITAARTAVRTVSDRGVLPTRPTSPAIPTTPSIPTQNYRDISYVVKEKEDNLDDKGRSTATATATGTTSVLTANGKRILTISRKRKSSQRPERSVGFYDDRYPVDDGWDS